MDNVISKELVSKAFTYESYKKMIEDKLNAVNPNDGASHKSIDYTKLNYARMKRVEKSVIIKDEVIDKIKSLKHELILLVIAEGWCGDVAQNLPVIFKMVNECRDIELKIILRDENPKVMEKFLTNGTKSIPVVIILNKENLEVLGKWGPRPKPAQEILYRCKARDDYDHDKTVKEIQLWYLEDSGSTLQNEFIGLLETVLNNQK